MAEHKQKWVLLTVLTAIFVLCFFVWQLKADNSAQVLIDSDTSVWDLRDTDMDDHYIRLMGSTAEYVPDAFLTPSEFETSEKVQMGTPRENAKFYTARIRLLVSEERVYAITMNSVDYADSIYINGQHMQTVGKPGTAPGNTIPQTKPIYFTVIPVDGVIEVLHQSAHFVHKEGGNPAGLRIGSVESIGRYFARQTLVTAVIMGACLLLFLVHMILFLLLRSYRTNLYFALFCLVWLLRTGVTDTKTITALFPNVSWYFTFHIEYMAIPLACLLIVLALSAMFDGLVQNRVKRAIVTVNILWVLFFLSAPTLWMTRALPGVMPLHALPEAGLSRGIRMVPSHRKTQ